MAALSKIEAEIRSRYVEAGDTRASDEDVFASGFLHMLLTSPVIGEGVGGIPVILEAEPGRHSYQNAGGVYAPGSITIRDGRTIEELPAGGNRYGFQVLGFGRNVPVTGVYFQEARAGYIYAPLEHDDAIALSDAEASDVIGELKRLSQCWIDGAKGRRSGG